MADAKPRYVIQEETRHAYNLVVIYPNIEVNGYKALNYDEYNPIGTLRFENTPEGIKEKEEWKTLIKSLVYPDENMNSLLDKLTS